MPRPAPDLLQLASMTGGGGWRLTLPHGRAEGLFLWITRGHGRALVDGAPCGVAPNTAIFVPAGQLLALENADHFHGHAILFPPGHSAMTLPRDAFGLRVPSVQAQADLAGLTSAMAREQERNEPDGATALRHEALWAHAALIAVWLRRRLAEAPQAASPRADEKLTRAFARRLAREAPERSVTGHATALGVTPSHLSRACRHVTGQAAADLLSARILHEARRRLADTDEPIGTIASALGFGNAASFTRFLQNRTNRSPSRLRADATARNGKAR